MSSTDERQVPEAGPPPPEWVVAPRPPWPPVPDPAWVPAAQAAPARRGVAVAVAATVAGLAIGAAIGSRSQLHGSRPTLGGAGPVVSLPFTPLTPSTAPGPTIPAVPTPAAPSTGSGPSATGTGVPVIAAAVDVSVVDINTTLSGGSAAGTGMVLTPTGEILTNNHVVQGATTIAVTATDTGRTYAATVVGTDPTDDVAILQLKGASGLTPIPVGNSATVSAGDSVVAVGNAGGAGGTPAAVPGTVQAVNQTITASDPGGANAETLTGLIQTNAPIQPGDSGGPLVNASAQVIGMDTAASGGRRFDTSATSVGFAIPIAHALTIARQIEAGQGSATVHLGVPAFLGVAVSSGASAQVTAVQPGSPADHAGLAVGDTITSIGGHPVTSPQTLSALIKSHRPGERASVSWKDPSGGSHTATVTFASGPPD